MCCLLIVSKVVVKIRYGVGLQDVKSCRIRHSYVLINIQYTSNMPANKQLVNSENWTLK